MNTEEEVVGLLKRSTEALERVGSLLEQHLTEARARNEMLSITVEQGRRSTAVYEAIHAAATARPSGLRGIAPITFTITYAPSTRPTWTIPASRSRPLRKRTTMPTRPTCAITSPASPSRRRRGQGRPNRRGLPVPTRHRHLRGLTRNQEPTP